MQALQCHWLVRACYRLAFQLSTTPSFITAGSQSWYETYGSVTGCLLQECQNPTKFKYVE